MKEILDKDGYSYIFLGMTANEGEITEGDIRSLSNEIKCKGKEIFEQKIFHHIQNKSEKGGGKLLFYAKLKQQFKQEKYLNLTKHRNAIRDIRMSIHKLQIETGRYIKVPKEYRLCNFCQMNKIEMGEHFILECPAYKEQRSLLSEDIKKLTGSGAEEVGIQAIKDVFEIGDFKTLNKFGKFLVINQSINLNLF